MLLSLYVLLLNNEVALNWWLFLCSYVIGFAFHFCIIFISSTWFLYLFHLFLGVVFPFQLKFLNEKKWKIRLHMFEVLGSVFGMWFTTYNIYPCLRLYCCKISSFASIAIKRDTVAFYIIVIPLCRVVHFSTCIR